MRTTWKALLLFDIVLCSCLHFNHAEEPQQQHQQQNISTTDTKQTIPITTTTIALLNATTKNNEHSNIIRDANNNGNINNNIEDTSALEMSIDNVKSFIMEKYGRHYRLTGDTSFDDLKSTAPDTTIGKKKDRIPEKTSEMRSRVKTSDYSSKELENGISDVKSIIMEKYGRHYRLTGGSTLASKRDKGEVVILDVSNTPTNKSAANVTSNAVNYDSRSTTVNKTLASISVENSTLNMGNRSTNASLHTSNLEGMKTASNESTMGNVTTYTKSNTGSNVTTATSKSDIQNATSPKPAGAVAQNNTVINLPITKNKTSADGGTQEIIFGSPPQTGDSENNITEEGNLTTITIDLTKGNTSAVIPGLDILRSPVQSVDVIVTDPKDQEQPPKRSQGPPKHKKHIVFQMTKPRIAITDFANKRKHVPHHAHEGKHVHPKKHAHLHGQKRVLV